MPALIISDFRVADGLTSIDAIGRIRTAVKAHVPGLIVSGDGLPAHLRTIHASGYHVLQKPLPAATLRGVLEKLLNTNQPSA